MNQIINDRDFSIRKGKILERFTEDFFIKYQHNPVFYAVYQGLIRDADPYTIIESLIDMNANLLTKLTEKS